MKLLIDYVFISERIFKPILAELNKEKSGKEKTKKLLNIQIIIQKVLDQ